MSPSETIQFEGVVTSIQFDSRKVVAAAGENAVRVSILFTILGCNSQNATL